VRSRVGAVLVGKAAAAASQRLGRGGGTALPGLLAERLDPDIVAHLGRSLGHGTVVVTGTNGKTTTARMVADILRAAGRPVLHNRSGSNLMRGLAATLTAAAGLDGRIPHAEHTSGVFEVDEATLPPACAALQPRVVVFTNLFRDQLDRYGEVDSIAALWREAVAALPPTTTLILNADDPSVAALRHAARGPVLTFGISDSGTTAGQEEHSADARWCGRCGREFVYTVRFFWHVGHWRCPGCGEERPTPDVAAEAVTMGWDGVRLTMRTLADMFPLRLPLLGLYNVANALAATAAALTMGAPLSAIMSALEGFTAAFGRQEALRVRGREVRLFLCKNPAGTNQVLRTLLGLAEAADGVGDPGPAGAPLHLLFVLNDDIADGRDVSWIWDVDFELLAGRTGTLVAAGTRAADLALRLKYAGLERGLALEPELRAAVGRALTQTPPGARLYILPTYTAMLAVREHLAALAGERHYWEQ